MLATLEKRLLDAGKSNFKFLIVGEGSERAYLEENMKTAEFTGFLQGEALSAAYANMDVFNLLRRQMLTATYPRKQWHPAHRRSLQT